MLLPEQREDVSRVEFTRSASPIARRVELRGARFSPRRSKFGDIIRMRKNSRRLFTIPAGIFASLLTFYGLAAIRGLDLRENTLLSVAYCALPLLSLPLFLLALAVRKLLLLQTALVLAYIPVYSALNWRTCAELGYCGSDASVVLMTIATSKVLLFWGVALSSAAAFVVERRGSDGVSKKNVKH
jgi:hypothetical protein